MTRRVDHLLGLKNTFETLICKYIRKIYNSFINSVHL